MAERKGVFSYDIIREGDDTILRIDCEAYTRMPSIEDDAVTMSRTIDILQEAGSNITKIVFYQKRDFEYDAGQTAMLTELSKIYNKLVKQRLSFQLFADPACKDYSTGYYNELQYILFQLLKNNPIGAYTERKRILRREEIKTTKTAIKEESTCSTKFIQILNFMIKMIDKTALLQMAQPYLAGHTPGDREIYRRIFAPTIKPDFMFTKLMATYPQDAEELDSYTVDDAEVTIFKLPNTIQYLYHIIPPEFKLTEEKYEIVDIARKIMSEHKPKKTEFVDPERMREVFYNVGHDLIEELVTFRNMKLRQKEIDELTKILIRYTVGFGLIEVLLQDEKVQDITINSPMGQIPIFIIHQDYDDCMTNIITTVPEAESWASKLRLISGRPLDEANPILDTELNIPGASARVAVISAPLNPFGLAYALRRHRDKPWTLPLFIKNRMISPLGAGIMSFIIDGSRTLLVAGTRSAGKTSVLSALITEIMRKYRIITIEDTLELPIGPLRKLGYNIQSLKVAAALTKGSSEVSAEEGIRTTLRMGDSCLIVGEVRSEEARALYEAMRVGALANVVAGTIHGDSPYGVYDRVVNDLRVPKTSFKATDIVIVANPIRSADGLHRARRITQITEVRKLWENDPLLEKGFVDLMKYDARTDQLEPSDDLINGDSEILKSIAGNVKEWAGNWDAVWDNILLRAKIKETLVNVAAQVGNPNMLEAEYVIVSNDEYHKISDKVKDDVGFLDSKRIFNDWNEWLKKQVKKSG